MKNRRYAWIVAVMLAAIAALGVALVLLSGAKRVSARAGLGVVTVERMPEAELPREQRGEDWFVGDWAGLITGMGEQNREWTDFGVATLNYIGEYACLLRVYETGAGYEAALGSALWDVTEHDMNGFTLACKRASRAYDFQPDSVYHERFSFEEGQTIVFAYEEEVKSSVPGALVPEKHLLFGVASPREFDEWNHTLLLSLLPPGGERAGDGGEYPCWFGGYENMEGGFHGMFCLGEGGRGKRMLAQVLDRGDGMETVVGLHDGQEYDRTFRYGPRDMRFGDLTELVGMDDADDAFFPLFSRYDAQGLPSRWSDVSQEHKLYYETVFIPQMEAEIAALREEPQDVWTQRQILARQGYIEHAWKLVYGDYDDFNAQLIPYIPHLLQLDSQYRAPVTLAGVKPGDTLEDAKRLHAVRPLKQEEAARFGMEGLSLEAVARRTLYYTDGEGLLLTVFVKDELARIGRVQLFAPGYETPDGRQVGDLFRRDRLMLYARDAVLEFGGWYLRDGVENIDVIRMTMALDRVWDETLLDIDGDGEKERLTLSGRALGDGLEQPSVFCDWQYGTVEPFDYGTKVTLSVYDNGALLAQETLPIATHYLLPAFCGKLQTKKPGLVWIQCETGGTGLEEPIYRVDVSGASFQTKFMGFRDIYS